MSRMGLAHAAAGLTLLVLVVAGIAGTIYKAISPDGWIAAPFGTSVTAGLGVVGSLLMLLALAWFSRGWAIRARNRHADVFVYVFAAIGTIFLAKLWLKGSF